MTTPYVDPQTIHNPATGTSPPASWGDSVRDGLEFCAKRPGCIAERVTQSIPNGGSANTAVVFNTGTELRDTDNFHNETTNNTRFVVPTGMGGWYRIDLSVRWAANNTGYRDVFARLNGSTTINPSIDKVTAMGLSQETFQSSSSLVQLIANDYVEMCVNQTSGGSLNITRATFAVVLEMVA